MGGGGGGFFGSRSRSFSLSELQDKLHVSEFNAKVNKYLSDLLKDYNDRDIEAIQTHLETLETAIDKNIDGTINLKLAGSIKKHTYIDGVSDVDALIIINDTQFSGSKPSEVLTKFADFVQSRLPKTSVSVGQLAVTVKFSDGCEVQLLPALKTATGIRISAAQGDQWSSVIKPHAFSTKLTEVNQSCGNNVVPVIKLFKAAIQSRMPEDIRLSGYHCESLAIEAFEGYRGSLSYKDMLSHMVNFSSNKVLTRIQDRTGQSMHVDDYLGAPSSHERHQASAYLKRLGDRMRIADSQCDMNNYSELFDD